MIDLFIKQWRLDPIEVKLFEVILAKIEWLKKKERI